MAFLDLSSYDIDTVAGQDDALSDLIDEMNSQNQDAELLNYLNIAAYGTITLIIPPFHSSGLGSVNPVIGTFNHNLGYTPAFLVFEKSVDSNNNITYQKTPNFGFGFNPISPTIARQPTAYIDNTTLYVRYDDEGSTNGYTVDVFYYIFSLPMPA